MGAGVQKSSGRLSRRGRKAHAPMSEINVTPFVDVMLVLLIVFMVAAPLLTAGVPIELPKTSAEALPASEDPLTVSIKSNGDIYVQEAKVTSAELIAKLTAVSKLKEEGQVFVRADQAVDYGTVMVVMGELNQAGFRKIGLITEMKEK